MLEQSNEATRFVVGDVLATKDGQLRTNAIIIAEGKVLTDFGNILEIGMCDIWEQYTHSENYLEAKKINYPLPTPLERIDEQILLLIKAKHFLKEKQ